MPDLTKLLFFNNILRFLLEISALIGVGYWGFLSQDGWLSLVLALGCPLLSATIWGIFAVPGDPGRSGKTVVITPGWIRLIIEFLFFGFGSFAFYDLGFNSIALVFALLVILHYLFSFARIKWLLSKKHLIDKFQIQ